MIVWSLACPSASFVIVVCRKSWKRHLKPACYLRIPLCTFQLTYGRKPM